MARKHRKSKLESGKKEKTENENMFLYKLKKQIETDCEFVVGPKKKIIKAHQSVLCSSSKVFEKMFSGNFIDKHSPIIIVDADGSSFQRFIFYLYSGEVEIGDVMQAQIFYYLAHKYDISSLKELSTNTNKIINEECFLKASMQSIKYLLCLDQLSITENQLIDAFMSWSLEEIIRQEISGEEFKEQQMQFYDYFTIHIRFESLTPKEFVMSKSIEKMLRPEIFLNILKHLASPTSPLPVNYTSGARKIKTMEFFYHQIFPDFILKNSEGEEKFVLYSAKCLIISGVMLSGIFSPTNEGKFEESIDVHVRGGKTDCHGTFAGVSHFNEFVDVYFDKDVELEKRVKYDIIIKMMGPNVFMAGQVLNKAFKYSGVYLLRDEYSSSCLNLNVDAFEIPHRKYTRLFGLLCKKKRHLLL